MMGFHVNGNHVSQLRGSDKCGGSHHIVIMLRGNKPIDLPELRSFISILIRSALTLNEIKMLKG